MRFDVVVFGLNLPHARERREEKCVCVCVNEEHNGDLDFRTHTCSIFPRYVFGGEFDVIGVLCRSEGSCSLRVRFTVEIIKLQKLQGN